MPILISKRKKEDARSDEALRIQKTVLGYLKHLPPPYRGRAIRGFVIRKHLIFSEPKFKMRMPEDLADALVNGIFWEVTREGHKFWEYIYDQLVKHHDDLTKIDWPPIPTKHAAAR